MRIHVAGLLAVLAAGAQAGPTAPTAGRDAALANLFYDFEVAGYCGLVDDSIGQGLRREMARLTQGHPLDPATLDRLRGEAWAAAHAEWQNRGLGGFRGWCREEGAEAARRLRAAGEAR